MEILPKKKNSRKEIVQSSGKLVTSLQIPQNVEPTIAQILKTPTKEIDFNNSLNMDFDSRQWEIYFYGQLETFLPGGGVALRAYKGSIGLEGNLSFFYFLFMAGGKCSLSVIKSFNTSGKGFYAGLGGGAYFVAPSEPGTGFYVPIFLGHQEDRLFTDVGADIVFHNRSVLVVPVVRCGWSF